MAAEEQHRAVCYREASTALKKAETEAACKEIRAVFVSLDDYKDSRDMVQLCDTKIQDLRYGPTYRQAIVLLKSKDVSDVEQAKELFESISGYKDAANYAQSCQKRIDALNNGVDEQPKSKKKPLFIIFGTVACLLVLCIVTVFVVMPLLGDHGKGDPVVALPSDVVENTLEPSAPTPTNTPSVSIGDIIKFGTYEQDNNTANGQEEIEWIVLEKKDGKALLISKYGLDCQRYNTTSTAVTWESCTLRNWLNTTFYTTAFNANQQSKIVSTTLTNADNPKYGTEGGNNTTDKVFLLSIAEAEQYFVSNIALKLTVTAYAKAQGAHVYNNGSIWWLRSPGLYSHYAAHAISDVSLLSYSGIPVVAVGLAVNPALWINLES